ncbi:acyl-CoA dehydrogenase family protein [Plantactinospora sp. KLBMP9567]|uniref:acyl-CoA dehydrogenase family protein n=1 Tax=Plantactinospora sp. KLBMP9567 TaxID=3085900 RepID=UPI002981E0BD|nr:acyl-CoA dehydrogenase family protein [Plantactinospora sp. KLBMP9567]MDW5329524.1 acyl-CoA dehydrogenase family protein [Plantactinospora sp. KLBMP9567]
MIPPVGAELRDVARAQGPVPALTRLYTRVGRDAVHGGPRGHAIVPSTVLARATQVCLGGVLRDRVPATERLLPLQGGPDGGEVRAVRLRAGAPPCPAFLTGLTWVRFGLSRGLLDATVRHARTRTVSGGPLLHQQLVKGTLADVLVELLAVESVLHGEPTGVALRELHDQITRADRMLLRLLGARGFVTAGPGSASYLSELLADAYVPGRDEELVA